MRPIVPWVALLLPVGAWAVVLGAEPDAAAPAAPKPASSAPAAEHVTESLRGKVVWLAEALQRRYGVESDADVAQAYCALETADGCLYPLVKDSRGRGFWLDERIRNVDVELLVRRYAGAPTVQVIRVYTIKDGAKYEFDYWCDICSIPMFELKACECCQGPIRMRERRVEPSDEPDSSP